MSDRVRENDLVLAPNEYAFISDQTKGNINVYVGPYKTSLANTDKPVTFDQKEKRFVECYLNESVTVFKTAPEGWYVVLKNPPKDGAQPTLGTNNSLAPLKIGRKVNIPGPVSFALWPGQMATIVQGHHLRSNEYLIVRVYDEEQARANWGSAVMKTKAGEDAPATPEEDLPNLTMGAKLIIKGTNVSFYIPPTGVEVVRDDDGNYVQQAVTLERMEYCILLDENGNKRYEKGPAVVFPHPTEEFVIQEGARKFRAIELNEISGLYIKVIAPYKDGKNEYKEGDELFITGKDQAIYYPRPEHAIIKYGSQDRHYSIVIPEGEGRYYLERNAGVVKLKKGPSMFLPDPRNEVLVRRVLEPEKVKLWFPGNQEALAYNQRMRELQKKQGAENAPLEDAEASKLFEKELAAPSPKRKEVVSDKPASEQFQRGSQFTPPRQITLDTKYEGAVAISVWTGYAVLVVNKKGERKVIQGPDSYLLEYDETLQTIYFSTGTPKTDENVERSVYLRSLNNKISDVVRAETKDFCVVDLHLSYRVNFEGDPIKWFNVENYVKFLCDHMRSFLRNTLKKHSVMDFYGNAIDVIRDSILGASENGKRLGRKFEENGMLIYDVEVLDVRLGDSTIQKMLVEAQHEVVKQKLTLSAEQRRLDYVQESERIARQISETQSETRQKTVELQKTEVEKQLTLALARLNSELEEQERRLQTRLAEKVQLSVINEKDLAIRKSTQELELELERKELDLRLLELEKEIQGVVSKAQAVSPDLIAALQAFSDRALAEKVASSMAPLSILGGKSVAEIFSNMLAGTQLGDAVKNSFPSLKE